MMKRLFLSLVSLMLTLQWFVVGAAVAKTINVAYPSPSWNTSLPVSMAKEFGLFTAEGLEVQPVYIRGGPVVMAALLGGDADFAVIAGVTAVTSIQRGADIVIVGKNPWTHGLDPNRSVLKKFVQYTPEQGFILSEPALDDLFAAME